VDPSGRISTIVGPPTEGGVAAPGAADKLEFKAPLGMTLDADGTLYVADTRHHRVVRVDPSGEVSVVAGTGKAGFSGMGGPATEARLSDPEDVAIDHDGNLYIGDGYDRRILKVDPSGVITTFAGTGKARDSGDGRPADRAGINGVRALAVDRHGSVYFAEPDTGRVRRIDRSGIIQTVAGGGKGNHLGDGGPATRATLHYPTGVWVDDGNLYIAEGGRVRKVDRSGVITTIAGTGEQGFSGDGGPAIEATLNEPQTVVEGPDNALYIADFENARVRKVCL
jgi:sugar lactone lactonase YvrE